MVVLDGTDVTPRSLISAAQHQPVKGGADVSGGSGSDVASGLESEGAMGSGMSAPDVSEQTPDAEEGGATELKAAAPTPAAVNAVASNALTTAELEAQVTLTLSETDTFFILDMPGECVAADDEKMESVKAQLEAYDVLLKKRVTMGDLYVESPAQTFNMDMKPKEQQTTMVESSEMGTQATEWSIYDTFAGDTPPMDADEASVVPGDELAPEKGGGASPSGGAEASSFVASGTDSSVNESMGPGDNEPGETLGGDGKVPEVSLKSLGPSLLSVLKVVERMVSQNNYQAKHLKYRNIDSTSAEKKVLDALSDGGGGSSPASLSLLWSFLSEARTKDRNVSCLEWNPGNRDLLVAGYGEFDFGKQTSEGLIGFWSLKNPDSADKMIKTPCGVTALAFSHLHPNLLAVGLYDGTVAIYDVRKVEQIDAKPILESGHGSGGKHTDPVWQLTWVDQGNEKGEILVSVSSDGRVTRWDMKKGLEITDLMKLKRVNAQAKEGGSGSEGIISRRASGMCIAFNTRDHNIYLAGTEDGHIHKCSCSYSEQHLESFFGHSGPVYKLRWSPFSSNTFLSCSADWTIKLWDQESPNAIFTFSSTTDYVADIAWSPNNSTVFASVTGDGHVDVWNIAINTLDPLTSISTGMRLSTVAFSIASPVLVVGHAGGGIDVYSLEGSLAEPLGRTVQEQINALEKVTATVHD